MLHSIPGSRGEGSGPPWSPSVINKVTITQSPPNRSGHMLMDKNNKHTAHQGYDSYLRGTETAKVGVCGLVKTLTFMPKHPDESNSSSQTPRAQLSSPFIVLSL